MLTTIKLNILNGWVFLVTTADIETVGKLFLLGASIIYTLVKIIKELKNKNNPEQ